MRVPTTRPDAVVTVRITAMSADGDGRALIDGRPIAVPGVIADEVAEVAPPRAGGVRARLLRVVQASPARVPPRCRHADRCGGCSWQHIAYPEQLRLKRTALQETLRAALGASAPEVAPVMTADGRTGTDVPTPWGFRHKVHFVCAPGATGRELALGHFAARGQTVVPVVECPVHADAGNRVAWALREVAAQVPARAATTDGRRGLLRHLVVRVGRSRDETLATLVVTDARDRAVGRVANALVARADGPDGVHVNELRGPSSWLFGPDTRRLHGRAWLREEVAGVSFLVTPTAFFQTNVAAAETLVRLVLDAIPHDTVSVVDLFAGVGLFALPLAQRGHRVLAVEEHPAAVAAGRRSQRLNGLDERRCRFVCGRAEQVLGRLGAAPVSAGGPLRLRRLHGQEAPDAPARRAVVMDPPRAGCPPGVLRTLVDRVRPDVLVYVSCEPDALARDLAAWLAAAERAGMAYRVARVQPVDMFPHTAHLETVAVLCRDEGPPRHAARGRTSSRRRP